VYTPHLDVAAASKNPPLITLKVSSISLLKPASIICDEDFKEQLEALNEELESLNVQARELESIIAKNIAEILEA
jgi:hypothetical protein